MSSAPERGLIRHEVLVACPIDHAFAVFTGRIDGWWPRSHRRIPGSRLVLEVGPDGRLMEIGAGGEEHVLGRVLAWEPPTGLCFSWRLGAPPEAPTLVSIRFIEEGSRTRVQVEHREGPVPLPDWGRTSQVFDRSWRHVLDAFQPAASVPAPSKPDPSKEDKP